MSAVAAAAAAAPVAGCAAAPAQRWPAARTRRAEPRALAAPRACSWFILKDGKIFWFKTDIVGPVRRWPGRGCRPRRARCSSPASFRCRRPTPELCAPLPLYAAGRCRRPRPAATCTRALVCSCAQNTQPRGIIEVSRCLSIKGAEDAINKPHAFEISTADQSMFFLADSDKARWGGCWGGCGVAAAGAAACLVRCRRLRALGQPRHAPRPPVRPPQEKEDWINAVGRAIVRHSKR